MARSIVALVIGSQHNGVFLSYARKDGEQFAANLRQRLREKAPDIDIKQDRLLLEGGVGWWKQLTEAIESVEFLVLVMTPSAMGSETVRKEWRYARQQGVCVYPVKAAPDSELKFSDLPRWMGNAHFYDLDKEWDKFIAHLRKGCDSPRVPFMAPDLPENFVQREEEFRQLKNLLLSADRKEPIAITTALSGAGGFGKTTLASALCHDEDIIQNFDDGILWVTLGQNPNVMSGLVTAYAGLTGERPGFANEEDAAFQLGQKLEERTCLFVIDDVWDESHLRPFLRGGKGCARLFTTRNAEIASAKARPVDVDEMSSEESQVLIAKGVPGLRAAHARELSQRLGEWPIALELAAAMMRQRIEQGDSAERAAQRLLQILDKKGPRGLVKGTGGHRNIDSVLEGSLELLTEEDRVRLIELSIFPDDISIPLTAAASLWRVDEFEAEDIAQRFARLYLLKLDLAKGSMRLHDVMQAWLASATPNAAELHSRLVDSWSDWMKLPDTYAWRWLPWHLAKAGREEDIEKLLWNATWLKAKLAATEINGLIADFAYLKGSPEAELIQGALRLSSHVLAKDPAQFCSQLTGRLLPYSQQSAVQHFLALTSHAARSPWLRPEWPALDPPGTAMMRTLITDTYWIYGLAVSADGGRIVFTPEDNSLKVWDLDSGTEPRTLTGHTAAVRDIAITPDGRRAVSASLDATLKVWDLETGTELHTLIGHLGPIVGVAITTDGRIAISASGDNTIGIWDLESGLQLHRVVGHTDSVISVAVTSDGSRAVSASNDRTLKVWDVKTGQELLTLKADDNRIEKIAISSDGRRAVSASYGRVLSVWDLEIGKKERNLVGHSSLVSGVAITGDGRRAISASFDQQLKLWDLDTGEEIRTLPGHSHFVTSVAITSQGHRAVSASFDRTLRVWNLENSQEPATFMGHANAILGVAASSIRRLAVSASMDNRLKVWSVADGIELRTLTGHSEWVFGVAMAAGGKLGISASMDNTLKVWDLESGEVLRTLAGHSGTVESVAIAKDGRRIVSASSDKTLKVWDLETGAELLTLAGHSDFATAVALTADGRRAVSASRDSTLKIWDLEKGDELRSLTGHTASIRGIAVTQDGRRVVSGSDDSTLKVWDMESGVEVRTLTGHTDELNGVALSGDGHLVVSASDDHTVKVWNLETGACIATHTCDSRAMCCAFLDEREIVVGDYAGRIHLLSLEFPEPS